MKFLNNESFYEIAIKVIAQHEGFRAKVYKDSLGIKTIGYGFNLESGTFSKDKVEKWLKYGIDRREADQILSEHVKKVELEVIRRIPWYRDLNEGRRLAILDMAFNMGPNWVNTWTNTMSMLKACNYKGVANAILKSKYATQVKGRAYHNATAFVNGSYPDILTYVPPIDEFKKILS